MTDEPEVLRLMEQAAARARGDEPAATDGDSAGADPDLRDAVPSSDRVQFARDRLEEASGFADAGTQLPPATRMKPVKQAILTFVRPVTSHQVPFNEQMMQAVEGLAAATDRIAVDVARQEQRATRLQAGIATTDLTVDDLADSVRRLGDDVDALTDAVEGLRRQLEQDHNGLRSELRTLRAKQELVFRAAREALPGGFDVAQLGRLSRELSTGYDELYQELEDTFRGTREHIMALAAEYLDDVRAVPGRGPVVDVGCGRGEWLELLRDAGIDGYGVDLNEVVVQRCQARGLDARLADALVHLRGLPEGSVRAVTSFHVVEHLSLDTLVQLIDAALVALRPGGRLIFETPNPTNLSVGASSFYIDPTHLKPLHPQFCQFLVLSRGFAGAELRYLHAEERATLLPDDLAGADPARAKAVVDALNWAMFGPLDYAVVATKAAAPAGQGAPSRDAPAADPGEPGA